MVNEGALIAFTLISQLVVGSLLVYTMIFFTGQSAISQLSSGFNAKTPEILLLVGMVIATIISFLHLGNPVNAIEALNNIATSWLSREILSLTLFTISLFLLFLGRWLMNSREWIISVLFLLSAIAGIYFIIVMIQLYTIPIVVSWATWHTPVSFAITTLILGITGVLSYFVIFNRKMEKIRHLLQLLMVSLFIEALISVLNYRMLSTVSIPHTNQFLLDNLHFNYTIIRIAAIIFVLVFLGLISRLNLRQERLSTMKVLLVLAIILVFIEQYAGRYLFYAGFVKTGI
jgi:anaerobic dimethyl sulfoxide reductase subunit C